MCLNTNVAECANVADCQCGCEHVICFNLEVTQIVYEPTAVSVETFYTLEKISEEVV